MRIAILLLVACSFPAKHRGDDGGGGSDDAHGIDAPKPDASPTGCLGQPFGTTAPSSITLSGEAADLGTGVIANGLTVNGMTTGGTNVFIAVTDANGKFSKLVSTGGAAIDAHAETPAGMYVPSYYYPSHPFDADSDIPLQMLTMSELTTQVGNPPNTALAEIIVGDCLNVGIAGCTVAFNPLPSKIEYTSGGIPTPSATSTEASGAVLVFGVPPGSVTISGTCPSFAMRPRTLTITANATYFIRLQP